jgi:hypothetical protein
VSVTTTVLLERAKLPSAATWARAIREDHDFQLELPGDLDLEAHDGFLPCVYRGQPAGFECVLQPLAAYLAEQAVGPTDERRTAIRARDVAVSFVTHSDPAGFVAACIASAVLASLSEGVLWSDEAAALFSPDEGLAIARDGEQDLSRPPPPPPARPRSIEVALQARIVFRGAGLVVVATTEPAPRRFTVKLDASKLTDASRVEITALWEHPVGKATAHKLRIDGVSCELDPRGAIVAGPAPVAT